MSEDLGNPTFLRYDFDDDTDSDVISGFFEKSVAEAISPGQETEETNFETDFQVFPPCPFFHQGDHVFVVRCTRADV